MKEAANQHDIRLRDVIEHLKELTHTVGMNVSVVMGGADTVTGRLTT